MVIATIQTKNMSQKKCFNHVKLFGQVCNHFVLFSWSIFFFATFNPIQAHKELKIEESQRKNPTK